MDPKTPFYNQVALLVRLLPIIGQQSCFALKGGTAINRSSHLEGGKGESPDCR